MGEYLTLFTQIKNYLYNGRVDAARDALKRLLNSLNIDYTRARNAAEREKVKNAIVRLLPALDDLKKGNVSTGTITALKLDINRLPVAFGGLFEPPVAPSKPHTPYQPVNPRPYAANQNPVQPDPTEHSAAPAAPSVSPAASSASPAAPQIRPSQSGNAGNGKNTRVKNGNILMPLTLDDYIGQEKAKRSLRISIGAAKKTGRPLAHLLICSPYGLGKTTLTNIIANEMGVPFFTVNATNLKDVRSLSLYFSKIEQSCIVFIDEIHTLKKEVQTVLLSIMTDFTVNFIDESGEEQHYDLPPFTLIGATTQAGELLKPFLNRFAVLELEDYTEEEKLRLVESKFKKMGYEATQEAISEIAGRCRGVPRTIETYVKGVIDVALSRDENVITVETTDIYFDIHEIDDIGLTKNDIKILKILDEADKPLALVTVESKSGIQKEDLEYRYEPYMIKLGFIDKTDRGRIITKKGKAYLHPDADGGKYSDDKDVVSLSADSPSDNADESDGGEPEEGKASADEAEVPAKPMKDDDDCFAKPSNDKDGGLTPSNDKDDCLTQHSEDKDDDFNVSDFFSEITDDGQK